MAAAPVLDPLAPDGVTVPEPPVDQPYGERNHDLPKQIVEAIRKAIKTSQNQEMYLRRIEVLHDRKMRFYERGHQHIYAGKDDCYVLAVPGETYYDADGNKEEFGDYIDDYPIFHGFVWIIQSVLTQNGPGIAFQPENPGRSEDQQAADTADGLRQNFNRVNDIKKIMREIVRMFCLSGRAVMWTKTEANAMRWGRDQNGNAKKNQTALVGGCLETKVPIMEKDMSNFPYLIWYIDADVRNLKQDHPHIKKQIKANEPGLDENNYERFARLGILQGARSQFQAGEAISHMSTELHAWLRPSAFSDEEFDEPFKDAKPEEYVDDRPPSVREMIAKIFADQQGGFTGLHAVFVGQTYSESWPESMDDCLIVETPFAGDGQSGLAIMDPAVIAQDRFSTLMNYIAETFDFGAPSTWVLASKVEYEAILEQRAQPYSYRNIKQLGTNTNSAADNFYREENPEVPATLVETIQFLMGEFLQFVLACPPAMWGESSADTKTASGLAQSRNQALGRMGILWAVLQKMCARMYYQVALAASNDPETPEEIIVPQEGGPNVMVRVERLRKGHFMAMPDEDSGFPDSTAAKRATMRDIVELVLQIPAVAEQFFSVPGNVKEICRIFGISEFKFPEAESYDKQTLEIEMLLNSVPTEPTPEEIALAEQQHAIDAEAQAEQGELEVLAGVVPEPPKPFDPDSLIRSSVPIQPWDNDMYEYQCCVDYLNSAAARQEAEIGRPDPVTGELVPNTRGIQNVWLHAQEHKEAAMLKMPPAPPMPIVAPKSGGGGGSKPEGAPPMMANGPAGAEGTATI